MSNIKYQINDQRPITNIQRLEIGVWDLFGNWKLEIGNSTSISSLTRLTQQVLPLKMRRRFDDGFTLVEMLVSMSIFLIFTVVSLGIYSSTVRAQRKTLSLNRIQQEAQFVMEFLGKMVRTSDIDYAAYGGAIPSTPPPLTQLILRDASNNQFNFTYDGLLKAIKVSVNGANPPRQISGASVAITDLNYIITPATTPFPCGGCPPTSQPRVTMVMRFSHTAGGQPANFLVQQTVPQRSVGF